MAWHPVSQSDIFPFLSFSRKTTKKGQLLISLALGVERVLDVDLARSFLIMPTRVFWHFFVFSVLIFSFRESWPSPNSPSTFSDGVSSKGKLQLRPWRNYTSLRSKTRSQSQQTRLRLSELEEGPRPLTTYGIHRINPLY